MFNIVSAWKDFTTKDERDLLATGEIYTIRVVNKGWCKDKGT